MANVNTMYRNADTHGIPAFAALDTYLQQALLAGSEPALQPASRVLLDDSLTLAQFTVVGLTAGKVVKAVYNATVASGVVPIGVLAHAAVSGATNTTIFGEVWLTGCFNAGAESPLVWDSTFDTEAKKTQWAGLVGRPSLIFRLAALA